MSEFVLALTYSGHIYLRGFAFLPGHRCKEQFSLNNLPG